MTLDDRFRPRKRDEGDQRSVSEQTPPTAPSAFDTSRREALTGQPHAQSPSSARAQSPSLGRSQPRYAPPNAAQRYAPPVMSDRDAPLIHPAAAQVARYTPYGVPVYRAPVYTYEPAPQRGLSITAMVLGLCSFVLAWVLVVVPIIGLVFGFIALRREPAGRAMAVTGLIGSALGLLWVALFFVLPLFGIVGSLLMGFAAP